MEYFDIISDHPLYTYHLAIPFCPSSSWLHKYYGAELLQSVKVVKGTPAKWGTCSRTAFFNDIPFSLAYWRSIIAVGLRSGDIIILDVVTGTQVAVLSGHNGDVNSVAFSFDGIFLVSGSDDETVKLWDVQTGGVVKTFSGHTDWVWSVSISSDCTTIASGSKDNTIRLWHVQTGDCFCVIDKHKDAVKFVSFSPTDCQLLMSGSRDDTVQQWDMNGCQTGPIYEGTGVDFSSDGTHFVLWGGKVATVRTSGSRVVVAKLRVSINQFMCCCFSSNVELLAGAAGHTIYIWNITGSDPHLIETLIGHTNDINPLIFPSSLISGSDDKTVKFWKTGAPDPDPVATDETSTIPSPSSIESVSLQARDGVAISSNEAGVVKTWDILTGLCKASFQTPAKGNIWRDAQLIEGRLIVVWHQEPEIHIWDAEKGESLQKVDVPGSVAGGIRISGDGSKVFGLIGGFIHAWSIWTGEAVGKVEVGDSEYIYPLYLDGSRIWVCCKDSPIQGWGFGISGFSPFQLLSNTPPDESHLDPIGCTQQATGPFTIKDRRGGRVVFQLAGEYAKPTEVQWDDQYLVAGYKYGEVLILDFNSVVLQ